MADKIHEIRKSGNIFFLLNAFLGAYNRRTDVIAGGTIGGDNQKLDEIIERLLPLADFSLAVERLALIHEAINTLDRKVDEFMATQEERLRGVKTKLDAIQSGIDKIQQQLADLKANNPELDDEISAIEATASAIDTDVNPVVTPPDTGGGTTGGEGGTTT